MAYPTIFFHFLLTFLLLSNLAVLSKSQANTPNRAPFKPNGLVLPVFKDDATGLHIANITKRTPQQSIPLLIDLNGKFLWVNCEKNYLSSTYFAPFCHSTQCARAGVHSCNKCSSSSPRPGCNNNTCAVTTTNPLTQQVSTSELAQDSLSIQSTSPNTQASNVNGPFVTIRNFLFACAPSSLLQGPLPKNIQGVAGFAHDSISLPSQLASHFGFPHQFSLCLPSSSQKNGAIFFGSGLYETQPGLDISRNLTYTPIFIGTKGEYIILVKSIRVNNKHVPLNRTLVSTQARNFGGALISTTTPYTTLEHNIFTSFTQFFANELSGVSRADPVSPFGLCFDSNKLKNTNVPNIDFVMQNKNVTWSIVGANSIVQAREGVSCLAFVDGGQNPRAPIVIGVHQLEDNFVQFDLARSRLGLSSSLKSRNTSCSNFNFASSSFTNEME